MLSNHEARGSADRVAKRTAIIAGGYALSLVNFRGPLIQALRRAGVSVHCTAPEKDVRVATVLNEWGASYEAIPCARNRLRPWGDLRYWWSIHRLCHRWSPDIYFAYTVKPIVFGLTAARAAGVRQRFALVTGLGYSFLGESPGRRVLRAIVETLYRWALKGCQRIFFQNPDDMKFFVDRQLVQPAQCSLVNGSGVDLKHFEAAPLPAKQITFLLVARLLAEKGIREFAAAASQVKRVRPDARFLLVGPPDPSPGSIPIREVQQWVATGVLDYLGQMDDVRPVLRDATVHVLPSYREGTPRTNLEAMATGRAVITTDVPGCRETVQDGVNGFLVPARNADALASAMLKFLLDPSLAARMGIEGRRIAEEKYAVEGVNAVILQAMGLST